MTDAFQLDTTGLTVEEALARLLGLIEERKFLV